MTPRTLWTILLKILGFCVFLQLLHILPRLFDAIFFISSNHDTIAFTVIANTLFSTVIYLFMIIAFIFRTDWLIKLLRLDKSIPEEKIELNMHRSTVLKIAVIVTGAILLIDSVPPLLQGLFAYYQNINDYNGLKRYPYTGELIFNLLSVFISFFMVTSSRLIVNFIERKRKGTAKTDNQPA
jgi:hypothetical protein